MGETDKGAIPELEARGVSKAFRGRSGRTVALERTDLALERGSSLGIIGESGAGKSTLLGILLGLLRPDEGAVYFRGRELGGKDKRSLAEFRASAQVVFQDPRSSLDPRMRVGAIIEEPLRALGYAGDRRGRVASVLEAVGLDRESASRYPHEFSGGQRQRIAIARAIAPSPSILIADEPVSALDVSVRAQILDLLADLKPRLGLSMIIVSHDLSTIAALCDQVLVLRSGRAVERGPTSRILVAPETSYVRELISAIPTLDSSARPRA